MEERAGELEEPQVETYSREELVLDTVFTEPNDS